ncbi:MAG: TIGR02587 family membrane protein [Proteobacteria bacterium]|nr:TIGR02587 family membrane protein [Pseudomonadota bacterium]
MLKAARHVQGEEPTNREFWIEFARAMAGALIFSFPLLMTMEMWWFGMYLDRSKIALFIFALLPILIGLSRYSGFRETRDWVDDSVDGLVAFAAGTLTAAVFLSVFAILKPAMSADEIIGKIAILTVPASMGAIISGKQLGKTENEQELAKAGYGGELFIMLAGALFLAFNVAPTEEMILMAYKMTAWHTIILVLITLLIMHGFVYTVGFRGEHKGVDEAASWRLGLWFTVTGYALAVLISAYVLWTFGRFESASLDTMLKATAVLAFPAGFGAALARLVI